MSEEGYGKVKAYATVPSDIDLLTDGKAINGVAEPCQCIYVGATGDVTVVVNGANVLYKAVPVGFTIYPRATTIKSSGTTATQLVVHW